MYFVIGPNGEEYGPADLNTLANWKNEGRVNPSTMLKDAQSGQMIQASSIPALFPMEAPTMTPTNTGFSQPSSFGTQPASPVQAPYAHYPHSGMDTAEAKQSLNKAYIILALSFVCGCCIGFPFAWMQGTKAEQQGLVSEVKTFRIIFGVVVALWVVGALIYLTTIGGAIGAAAAGAGTRPAPIQGGVSQ